MNQEKFKKINKACFLDRDGVINKDTGYLYKIEDFQWIDGAIEAIKYLKENEYIIIVITNQSGIERGFYKKKDVYNLHDWINSELRKENTFIDDFFISTELPSDNPQTRKPSPKMINEAVEKYKLDRSKCFLIGDKTSDLKAAKNAGIKSFLFKEVNLYRKVVGIIENKNL